MYIIIWIGDGLGLSLGSLSSYDNDGNEKVAWKTNFTSLVFFAIILTNLICIKHQNSPGTVLRSSSDREEKFAFIRSRMFTFSRNL